MSNRATDWFAELDVSNIKYAAYKVLFRLCVHHNQDKPPAVATYPSQASLMKHAKLSNGGVNKALNELEEAGLISRRKSTKPGTKTPRTYYLLGCDMPLQTPNGLACTNSTPVEPVQEQTPLSEPSNSTKSPIKLHSGGDEHLREHLNETSAADAAPTRDLEFDNFLNAHPRPKDPAQSRKLFDAVIASGMPVSDLIKAAQIYADQQKNQPYCYIAGSDAWLKRRGYVDALRGATKPSAADPANAEKINERWVKAIKTGHQALARHCSVSTARKLIAQSLVTEAQCRDVGISL